MASTREAVANERLAVMAADGTSTQRDAALAAFNPERFGFRPFRSGWIRYDEHLGPIVICALGWEHAEAPSWYFDGFERTELDALSLIVKLQDKTWGMPPEDLVPVNLLAVIQDTGGANLVAYELDKGFNIDGWLGFVIGAGSSTGTLVSHMLGVHESIRGARDIGWYLKVVQGYLALSTGHRAMSWTFDPMRGANARLNLEKLGARINELAINKYGVLRSSLYGDVPSDRFAATWDLFSPRTWERIGAVHAGRHVPLEPGDVSDVLEITAETSLRILSQRPERVKYRIPGDIDALMRTDPHYAITWREEMRAALTGCITTKIGVRGAVETEGPVAMSVRTTAGDYAITGFATGHDEHGVRASYYVFERKQDDQKG